MKIKGIVLDDVAVAAARRRFQEDRAGITGVTFKKLLSSFTGAYRTHRAIAKELGVSRNWIGQWYEKYVRDALPGKPSGRDRQKAASTNKRAAAMERLRHANGPLMKMMDRAREAGLKVKHLISDGSVSKTKFLANGICCSVSHLTTLSGAILGVPHVQASFFKGQLRKCHFKILLVEVPGFSELVFVVPTLNILQCWGSGKGTKSFLVPIQYDSQSNASMSWYEYKDAWYLLRRKKQ